MNIEKENPGKNAIIRTGTNDNGEIGSIVDPSTIGNLFNKHRRNQLSSVSGTFIGLFIQSLGGFSFICFG